MVLKYTSGGIIRGTAAEKTTISSSVPLNTIFIETDTNTIYRYSGSGTWVSISSPWSPSGTETLTNKTLNFTDNIFPNLSIPTYYTIYKQTADSVVKCRDNITGTVVSSSATQETPIQYAIDNSYRKSVYIAPATYNFSAGFGGLVFPDAWTESRIFLDAGAELKVPQAYAGSLWTINKNSSLIKILGGKYSEQGTPSSLWKCFRLSSNSTLVNQGINSCTIGDCYIRYPDRVVSLESSTTNGWINSCTFQNIFADRFVHGIYWDQSIAKGSGNGINLCKFFNNILQMSASSPISEEGFRSISGDSNNFIMCDVWDTPVGKISSNLTSEATNTLILGGKMRSTGYSNLGVDTIAWDSERGIQAADSSSAMNKLLMSPITQTWATAQGIGIVGDGLLGTVANCTETGTAADTAVYADGHYRRYTSGATSGDNAGYRFHTTAIVFRGWLPYYETKFRVNQTANLRFWCGLQSGNTEPTGDNAFGTAGTSAVGVGYRATDSNFLLFRNNGSATMTYSDVFAIAKDTAIHTMRLFGDDANSRWTIYLDDARIDTSSNIPAQTTGLFPFMHVETTEAVAKSVDRFSLHINPKNSLL
jgi:hypothetical protein